MTRAVLEETEAHLESALALVRRALKQLPATPSPASLDPPRPPVWPGPRLKALRAALGLSQTGLARLLGLEGAVAFTTISKWENAHLSVPVRCHSILEALEQDARKKLATNPPPAPKLTGNGPIASAFPPSSETKKPEVSGPVIRRNEACGCQYLTHPLKPGEKERLLRQCQAHFSERKKYQPQPPRTEPRPPKAPTIPLPRAVGPADILCQCKHPARDHENRRFRCYACGTGHGTGCQLFRSA